MNSKLKQIFLVITGLIFIAGISVGGFLILRYFGHLLLVIDKQVAAAIIAASATLLAAVGVALYSQRGIKKREIAEAHRSQKIEVYNQFMATIVQVLRKSKENADNSADAFSKEFEEFFVTFTRDLIVWGSPGVIKAWENFRRGHTSSVLVLILVDDILREIRKDLGNSNWSINKGDLIKLFLKDPDEMERMLKDSSPTKSA